MSLCFTLGQKPKTERYVIGQVEEGLSIFRIFTKTGKELGGEIIPLQREKSDDRSRSGVANELGAKEIQNQLSH